MKYIILAIAAGAILLLLSHDSIAGAPTCNTHNSGPYCQYTGRVSRAYVNESNMILLYFDANMDAAAPSSVGISGVSRYSAAAYRLDDNPAYGNLLYATLLTAQAQGAQITVQMRRTYAGYLVIDRIWLYE